MHFLPMRGAAEPSEAADPTDFDGRIDLVALVKAVVRRWVTIAGITAVFLAVAAVWLFVTPPTWRATSRVLLDPRDKQVVGDALERPMQGGVDAVWIDTQADLVRSAKTLRSVVESEHLVDDPEFGGGSVEDVLREFSDVVLVVRPELTYVLDVNVTTGDAEKSARLSRALADAFVKSLVDAKADSVRQANDLLSAQVDDLRNKARDADNALQAYKRENGILAANGRLVDEDSLQLLNTEYNEARLAASAAKARRDRLQAALKSGLSQLDGNLEASNSAVISRLKIEYALAERTVADLGQQLGPNHPRLQAARAQVDRILASIKEELKTVAETAVADYELAASRERNAKTALDTATKVVNATGAAGVRLRELENEAAARREIYRAFVSRIEETGQQQNLQISDARVIVPAPVPDRPYSPRRTLTLALALIAGLGAGVAAAIYKGGAEAIRFAARPSGDREPQFASRDDRIASGGAGIEVSPLERDRVAEPAAAVPEPSPVAPVPPPAAESPPPVAEAVQPARTGEERPPLRVAAERAVHAASANQPSVVATVIVDTAPEAMGRHGRPIARSGRGVLASAFETDAGRLRADVLDDLADRLDDAAPADRSGGIVLVQNLATPTAGAAASLALAAACTRAGADTLLVDAAGGALAAAFLPARRTGIADVVAGLATAGELSAEPDEAATVVSIPGRGRFDIEPRASRVAEMIGLLAEDFGRTVVHCEADVPPRLLAALVAIADHVLVAVDAAVAADAAGIVADLAEELPRFCGLVLVEDLGRRDRAAA